MYFVSNKKLSRNFIDNYKNNFNVYQFINNVIADYWIMVNNKFLMLHTLDPLEHMFTDHNGNKISEYNLFNIFVNQNKLLYPLRINRMTEVKKRQDNGTNILDEVFAGRYGYQTHIDFLKQLEYCYNSEFVLSTRGSDFYLKNAPKLFNVNDKVVGYQFYNAVVNIIPYIYNRLRDKIYELLEIDKEDYTIQFSKIYQPNEYYMAETYNYNNILSKDNMRENFDIAKFMPFVAYSNMMMYYYYNRDIKYPDRETVSAIIVPTEDKILLSNYDHSIHVNSASNYGYDHTPYITGRFCLSYNVHFVDGYIPEFLLIGNLINHLSIDIIKNDSNNNMIIAYNKIGQTPKIIHNTNSINIISEYNNKNIEQIITPTLLKKYKDNESIITELLDDAAMDLYNNAEIFENGINYYFRTSLKDIYQLNNQSNSDNPIADINDNIPYIFIKLHHLLSRNMTTKYTFFDWRNNNFQYKYDNLFALRFYVLGDLPANVYFNLNAYNDHTLIHYNNYINTRYRKIETSFKQEILLISNTQNLTPILSQLRSDERLADLLSDVHYKDGYVKRTISGKYPQCLAEVNGDINFMLRAFLLMKQYGINIIEKFLTDNLEKITIATYSEKAKQAAQYKRANIRMRQNEFKKEKLQYYNNIQTINSNANIQDIAIETSYYNQNINIIVKNLNV